MKSSRSRLNSSRKIRETCSSLVLSCLDEKKKKVSLLLVFFLSSPRLRSEEPRERERESEREHQRDPSKEREREFCVQFSLIGKESAERENSPLFWSKNSAGKTGKRGKIREGKFKFEHTSYRVCCKSSNGYRRNSATEESLESIFVET